MEIEPKEIFKYEYKRCFFRKMQLWMVFCFLISGALFWFEYRESNQDVLYKDIVEPYRGLATQEKIDEIKEKTAYYQQVLAIHQETSDLYARDKISDEEFDAFIKDYRHAKKYVDSWLKLCDNALRFEAQESQTYFFYDVAWGKLFANKIGWPFLFLFITLLVPYFYLDIDSKQQEIIQSYCGYPKLRQYRLRFAAISVVLLQILWAATELTVILLVSSLPDKGMSACSLSVCSQISSSVSLLQFFVLKNLLLLLKRAVDSGVLYCLSGRIKNKMVATVLLLIYLLITDMYYLELLRWVL